MKNIKAYKCGSFIDILNQSYLFVSSTNSNRTDIDCSFSALQFLKLIRIRNINVRISEYEQKVIQKVFCLDDISIRLSRFIKDLLYKNFNCRS